MAVRSPHSRRLVNATRTAAPVSSEYRIAEALEDRTLLSATTELIDVSQQPIEDDVEIDVVTKESGDLIEVETTNLEGLVESYLEAQLAFAETADWESSVESRVLFGEVRLTALAFIGKDDVPLDQTDEGTSPYYEIVSAIPLDAVEKQLQAKGDPAIEETREPETEEKFVDTGDAITKTAIAEITHRDGRSESYLVTILVHQQSLQNHSFIVDEPLFLAGFPGFAETEPGLLDTSHRRTTTITSPLEDVAESADETPTILVRRDDSPTANGRDSAGNLYVIAAATLIDANESSTAPLTLDDCGAAAGFEATDFATSSTGSPEFLDVGFENWSVDDDSLATRVTLAATSVASVETQLLLASVDPAEISGVVAEPFQPVIGLASTVVLMRQTLGRTAMLAVFGDAGSGGGPIAEFVEPIIDLADVGAPSERWELKTVDSVIPEPIAQAVNGDRHFEIRNIGPAANVDGQLPDVATLTLLTLPRHGVLEHVGVKQNVFRYVPDPGFSGVDEFRYRLKTSSGQNHEGQLVINVPAQTSQAGLRTATRDIEVRLEVEHNVAVTNHAFEGFEDWRSGLD